MASFSSLAPMSPARPQCAPVRVIALRRLDGVLARSCTWRDRRWHRCGRAFTGVIGCGHPEADARDSRGERSCACPVCHEGDNLHCGTSGSRSLARLRGFPPKALLMCSASSSRLLPGAAHGESRLVCSSKHLEQTERCEANNRLAGVDDRSRSWFRTTTARSARGTAPISPSLHLSC